MIRIALMFPLYLSLVGTAVGGEIDSRPNVVLLHGLARSASSMAKMAGRLEEAGFAACNVDYPGTSHTIEELTEKFVLPKVLDCRREDVTPIHFVTHSMGGIIVRQLAATHPDIAIGRVVMLAPPNRGSELIDKLGHQWLFKWINGPAGQQLGTGPESLPNRLGAPPFELGIITGDRSINLINSLLIPGPDDGKVAVKRARLEGMCDFLVVHATHPLIMRNREVIAQTVHFLRHGSFQHGEQSP